MATYTFADITPAQALAFGSADSVTLPTGSSAKTTTVLYLQDGTFSVTIGAQTVVFGSYFPSTVSRLQFPDGSKLFVGRADADTRNAGTGISTGAMYGGDGADTLTGSKGEWFIQGNQGDDRISAWSLAANTMYGGQGNDHLSLIGGGADPIKGQFMQGNKGNDTIQGDAAGDTLLGGQGNDLIYGNGDTSAWGGDGDGTIQMGTSSSALYSAWGDGGNDTLRAHTSTRSQLDGGDGADVIQIIRNLGSPVLYSATIDGGAGNDTIQASDADDRIRGGTGADSLNGGSGADTFIQDGATSSLTLAAADRIGDWTSADRIQLRTDIGTAFAEGTEADFAAALSTAQAEIGAGQTEAMAIQVGQDVIVFGDASAGAAIHSITMLVGRSLADISADNFV